MPRGTPPDPAARAAPRPGRARSSRRVIAYAALVLVGLALGSLVASAALSVGHPRPAQSASPRNEAAGSDTSYVAYGVNVARDGSPEPPTPTPTPSPTPTPPAASEPPGPVGITVWMDGDSTSFFATLAFFDLMTDHGATPARCARYIKSSGLLSSFGEPEGSGCDDVAYAGWDSYLVNEMALYDPDLVVLMIAANDVTYGMDLGYYATRVGQIMDLVCGQGRFLAYVGMTNYSLITDKAIELSSLRESVNAVFASEAAKRPMCVRYVDTSSVTADGYDGVHFSWTDAARPVAQAIFDTLYRP